MPDAVVSLLTDFGYADAYVGVMTGVIASRCDARVIDLTHGVDPGDITSAAYLLGTSWRYFPPGTVHLSVVDPGVGTDRGILAAEVDGHRFVAPDNGLLADVLATVGETDTVVRVSRPDLHLPKVSQTFHGRDVFAPIAAAIASGEPIAKLGEPATDWVRLGNREPQTDAGRIEGEVVYIDRFGNLITSIHAIHLAEATRPTVQLADRAVTGLAPSYESVEPGELLAIIGSTDRLEISINGANAAQELGVATGEPVQVTLGA